jgi:hypothetical protein
MAKKKNFFEKPWAQITGVIIIIITILGGGYAAGAYQEKIQCNLDKNILVIEYQSKLRDELNKQKECETNRNDNNNAALTEIINIIRNDGTKK